MAKLGQQVKAQELAQQPQRANRVQRVKAQRDEANFVRLQAKAKQVQETQFKDKVVSHEETYYEYRPKKYSERDWNRLRQEQRDAILKPYRQGRGLDYYANRGELVRTQQTRTVSETLPFTLDQGENSYENIYASLDKDLKPFFATPESLKQQRSTRIQTNLSNVNLKLDEARAKNAYLDQKYSQDRQALQDWWQNKSSSYRSNQRNRDNYNERRRDLEDDYEEDKQKQRGIIEGLEKGKGQLSQEKDIDINDIENYANDLARYYEDREEARNDQKAFERKQVKDLEKRQAEAQAKGFNFTGTINESFVDPKKKVETKKGVKYYLGGAEVTPAQFSKQFDIYKKPSGSTFFVAKGTDLSKLSVEQQKVLFPEEFVKAQEKEAQRLQTFQSNVNSLPITDQTQAPAPKKSVFKKAIEGVGDVLSGVFFKSTVGLGLRGFLSKEPTPYTKQELEEKRSDAFGQTTILGFTKEELKTGKTNKGFSSLFGFGLPTGIDFTGTQVAGIKLSKDIRQSGELAIEKRKVDVTNINTIVEGLNTLQAQKQNLNQRITSGKVEPQKAQDEFNQIQKQELSLYQKGASQGIKSTIETNPEGVQTVSFTSKSLEQDLEPASIKILRDASTLEKTGLIAGGLGTEALEFGTFGLILGGTGTSAKIGLAIQKALPIVKPIISASPLFPLATKAGVYTALGTVLAGNIGFSGYKGIERGEKAGIGKVGGFALGAGIPLTQTVAFAGGAYVGNKIYTENIVRKLQQGGFTKPTQEKIVIDGKEYKVPAQARGGKTEFTQGKELTRVVQADKLQTKIPGTDIKIETIGKIDGKFVGKTGGSLGKSVSTISGKQAGAYAGQKTLSRALYFDKNGQTAIVTFTKTPKGVRVDQFLTGTKATNFKILGETAQGGKTVFVDFNRYVARVGDPIYVSGGSLTDTSIKATFNRFIGSDTLFNPIDDLSAYTIGRTQQVISISPKVAKSATFDTAGGAIKIISEKDQFQTFASIGSSRVARTDALKALINQISKQEGGFAFVTKGLLANKRGQFALPSLTKPETLAPATTLKIPASVFSQDQFVSISPLTSELSATIKSALGTNTLLGTSALLGVKSGFDLGQKSKQNLTQRLFSLQLQNVNQVQLQQPGQQQQQKQSQRQQTIQQQIQQQIQIDTPISNPTPSPVATPRLPGLPDFDLQFFKEVRKKAGKKRQKKDLAYVQDFTSKVVGFKPIEVSEREAVKLAQKVQTGFELRAPIIVRKNNKDQRRLKRLLSQ